MFFYRLSRPEDFINTIILGAMSQPPEIYEISPCTRCQTISHKCHQCDVCTIFSWFLKHKARYSYTMCVCVCVCIYFYIYIYIYIHDCWRTKFNVVLSWFISLLISFIFPAPEKRQRVPSAYNRFIKWDFKPHTSCWHEYFNTN